MKILLSTLLLSTLLTGASHAALTITIAPGTTGSLFTVVQTSPNPVFGTDAMTSGFVLGIPVPGQSLVQNPALVTSGSYAFSASLGTVGKAGRPVPLQSINWPSAATANLGRSVPFSPSMDS